MKNALETDWILPNQKITPMFLFSLPYCATAAKKKAINED